MTVATLVEIRHARKRYGAGEGSFALTVDLVLNAGDRLALLGASGSGKSTLLNLLGLALRPDDVVRFVFQDGQTPVDVDALWTEGRESALASLRGRRIGFVPQSGGLLPFLTVRENANVTACPCFKERG